MVYAQEPHLPVAREVDPTPLPDAIPKVKEVGASSAPLTSAAFFIGARCLPYNDDFMLCKDQSTSGNPEFDCLKEGRRVTRCASSVIQDINSYCAQSFQLHWKCLEDNNHEFKNCRKAETLFNKCVFDNLKLEKKIPGVKESDQIHLKAKPLYAPKFEDTNSVIAFKQAQKEGKI